jgi:ribonuclease VapC
MIVDSSAVVAMLRDEPEAPAIARALAEAPQAQMTAANWLEAAIVAEGRNAPSGTERFDAALAETGIEVVPVTAALARRARDAWRRYGKGRHPAGLNFGDCFAYALATERDEPLLFKGADFAHTDVKRAL